MRIDPRILDPGERLVWSGRPLPFPYAIRRGGSAFLFGGVFFGFSLFWTLGAGNEPEDSVLGLPFWAMGLPFVLVGVWFLSSPLTAFVQARGATYVVTDKRAIMDFSTPFARRVSVPLRQIKFIETRHHTRGPDDLLFQEVLTASADPGDRAQLDGFIAIESAGEVERALRTAVERAQVGRV